MTTTDKKAPEKTPTELFAERLTEIEATANQARRVAQQEFDALMAQINQTEVTALNNARNDLYAASKVTVTRDDGQTIDFAVGQVWTRRSGVWETGKRVIDMHRRQSVTFLKTTPLRGGKGVWESAGLMINWIDETGATLNATKT